MNCYICAREGTDSTAVALCPHCHAGLCLVHVEETAVAARPGGMFTGCTHNTWNPRGVVRTT